MIRTRPHDAWQRRRIADPKAILFYMGLLPAFLDLSRVSLTDTTFLMSIATAVVGGVKLGYAHAAERATSLFESSKARRRLDMTAATVMLGAGIHVQLRG